MLRERQVLGTLCIHQVFGKNTRAILLTLYSKGILFMDLNSLNEVCTPAVLMMLMHEAK